MHNLVVFIVSQLISIFSSTVSHSIKKKTKRNETNDRAHTLDTFDLSDNRIKLHLFNRQIERWTEQECVHACNACVRCGRTRVAQWMTEINEINYIFETLSLRRPRNQQAATQIASVCVCDTGTHIILLHIGTLCRYADGRTRVFSHSIEVANAIFIYLVTKSRAYYLLPNENETTTKIER